MSLLSPGCCCRRAKNCDRYYSLRMFDSRGAKSSSKMSVTSSAWSWAGPLLLASILILVPNLSSQQQQLNLRQLQQQQQNLTQAVSATSHLDWLGANKTAPADWLMIDGADDMATAEGKHSASFSSSAPTKKQQQRRKQQQQQKANNKTMFDDDSSSAANQAEMADSSDISEDTEEGGAMLAGSQKEPECAAHGRYYCTYKEEYPLKLVTEVTKYYKWPLEKLFRDLHAQIMPKLAQDSTGNLVCDSITRVVRPGWARNTNDRWLVVINTENYHQYVTEVVCQYGGNSRCNFIPPCYYSSCQQRYNTQKLLVIDPTNPYRGPFLSEFLFPSCCVCYVPSASDSFQDRYRGSPATIYQRTLQQEAATNLYPPKFKPVELVVEDGAAVAAASSSYDNGPPQALVAPSPTGSSNGAAPTAKIQLDPANQPMGPGEIRRSGDQFSSNGSGGGRQREARRYEPSNELRGPNGPGEIGDFPRLSLVSDSSAATDSSSSAARQ